MTTLKLTHEEIAARFGCTVSQVRAQWAKNAVGTLVDIAKAERTGRKIRQQTAAQLRDVYSVQIANAR